MYDLFERRTKAGPVESAESLFYRYQLGMLRDIVILPDSVS